MAKLLNSTIILVSSLAFPMLVNTAAARAPVAAPTSAAKPNRALERLWRTHGYKSNRTRYGLFHASYIQPHAQREWRLGRLTLRLPMFSRKGVIKRLEKGKAVRLSLRQHELTAGFREIMSHSTRQVGPAATADSLAGMLGWAEQAEAFIAHRDKAGAAAKQQR